MENVSDNDHCSVIFDLVDVWKGPTDQHLTLLRSCHSAPITLQFETKNKRNDYFTAIVAAIAAYTPPAPPAP